MFAHPILNIKKTSSVTKKALIIIKSGKGKKKSITSANPLDATNALPFDSDYKTSTLTDSRLPRSKDEYSDDDDTNSSRDSGEFFPTTQ